MTTWRISPTDSRIIESRNPHATHWVFAARYASATQAAEALAAIEAMAKARKQDPSQ